MTAIEHSGDGVRQPPPVASGELATAAWELAVAAHDGDFRPDDGAPFIDHPVRVAGLVAAQRADDETLIAAALLHDVLERSECTSEEVHRRFGPRIGGLVDALSDDPAITDYRARKAALREQVREAGPDAALIYASDKLANSSDLRAAYEVSGPEVFERFRKAPVGERIEIWRSDLEMAAEVLGPSPLIESLRDELDALEEVCAQASA